MRAGYFVPHRLWGERRMSKLSPREWHAISRMYGICDKFGRFLWSEEALTDSLWLEGSELVETMATLDELRFVHPYEVDGRGYAVIDRFDQDAKKNFISKRTASELPDPPDDVWIEAECEGAPTGSPGKRIPQKMQKAQNFSKGTTSAENAPTPHLTSPHPTEPRSGSPQVQSTKNDPAGSPESKAQRDAFHEAFEAESRRKRVAEPYVEPLTRAEHRAQYLEQCRLSRERKARETGA